MLIEEDIMKPRSFLKLVEIQTKVASVIPFLLGTVYAFYTYNRFNLKNFLLMFVSLICIDMCTTAINNYIDFKKAQKKEGYGYEKHNAIVRDNLKERDVLITIGLLLSIAIVFGILLYLNTNVVVLLLGMLSFLIGITYTFGPVPTSRTPLGELLSGGFMGLIIPFLAVYIHVYDQDIVNIKVDAQDLILSISYLDVLKIFLISLPAATGIANIMLANNICDIEDDIINRRYTLPIYIGKDKALILFRSLYYIGFLAIILSIILKVAPLAVLLALLTYVVVHKNINAFMQLQTKKDTFVFSVQNFVIVNLSLVFTIGLGIIIKLLMA